MNIGKNIKYYRNNKNLTQKELAQELGMSTNSIQKYEADEREPDLETLNKIADILDVSLFDLIQIEDSISRKLVMSISESIADLKDSFIFPYKSKIALDDLLIEEIISMYTNVSKERLTRLLTSNFNLTEDELIYLIDFFNHGAHDKFLSFIYDNLSKFKSFPKVSHKLNIIINKDLPIPTISPKTIISFISLLSLLNINYSKKSDNSIILFKKVNNELLELKLTEDEFKYIFDESLQSINEIIIKFNGIPNNPFSRKE